VKLNKEKLDARVARARSAIRKGTKYKMGRGGFKPSSPLPHDAALCCDCSGFVAWCIFMSRSLEATGKDKRFGMGWIETTNIYRDAMGPERLFRQIEDPVPGCGVVYPDKGGEDGHVGIVSSVQPSGAFTVVDCSSGQYRRTRQAITERDGRFFLREGGIFFVLNEDYK